LRIPFLHYTSFDNLPHILEDTRLVSRNGLRKNSWDFDDISIDPAQPVREELGLLDYIPLFAGFYELFRSYELNGYLMNHYDDPKVQNKSFYGTLNKTLQPKMGDRYENIIILLVDDEHVYKFADQGKVRFFTDLAVKEYSRELSIDNRADLKKCLEGGIEGTNISGEVDLLDDGVVSVGCMSDIEAIIVDNDRIKAQVLDTVSKYCKKGEVPVTIVSELPRNPIPE
jgi:hypothetical protein